MSMIKKMYLKELNGERDSITGHLVIIVGFYLIITLLSGRWEASQAFAISIIPLHLMPIWYLFYSFDILHREWKEQTLPLFLGVPMKASHLLLSKMLSLWTTYLIVILAILTGVTLISGINFGGIQATMEGLQVGLAIAINNIINFIPLTPAAFLIYLTGVSFNRWASAVRVISGAFLAMAIIYGSRIANIFLEGVIFIIPLDFPANIGSNGPEGMSIAFSAISQALFLVVCLVGILSFFLSAGLLEKKPRA